MRRSLLALSALAVLLAGCGGGHTASVDPTAVPTRATLAKTKIPAGADWLRFNVDAQRSGVYTSATGLNAHNVGALRLRRVNLPGTVDSSAIALHRIVVGGHRHDVLVMTTTYGRTLAVDPGAAGSWDVHAGLPRRVAGSAQITTATPLADPDRRFVYASSPDGRIHKLAVVERPRGAGRRLAG